jgi:kynurenine formamidase
LRDLIDLTMPFSSCTIPVPGHPQPAFESLHELERDGVRIQLEAVGFDTSDPARQGFRAAVPPSPS